MTQWKPGAATTSWQDFNTTSWASQTQPRTDTIYRTNRRDLGRPTSFVLTTNAFFTGGTISSMQIQTSNNGTTFVNKSVDDKLHARYFRLVATVTPDVAGVAPVKRYFRVRVFRYPNIETINNVDLATLVGSTSSRILPTRRKFNQVLDINYSAPTGHEVHLVSSGGNPSVTRVKGVHAGAWGKPDKDFTCSITLLGLPRMVVGYRNNIEVR